VLAVRAFAKINLTLRVTGRRADGFHDVRTVLQTVALHDTLRFRRTGGPFQIECTDPACPTDRANLVWQAAERVWRAGGRAGSPRGAAVRIYKRIPLQAGLGGGSSDAAAAIRALSRLWAIDLTPEREREIAASLGADVPFFLLGGTALGVERGDVLFPLPDLPASWVAIAVPPLPISTAAAYAWWDERRPVAAGDRGTAVSGRPFGGLPASERQNDLQPVVAAHHPKIGRLVGTLERAGAGHAAMSGSGSAVFGLFPSRRAADAAAARVRRGGAAVLVTKTVDRQRFMALLEGAIGRR